MEELQKISLEEQYLRYLEQTPSNVFKNALEPDELFVKNVKSNLHRVGAHFCISSIFEEYPENIKIYCYSTKTELYAKKEAGKFKLATGKLNITSDITWDEKTISFTVLHMGDHNINAGVKDFQGNEDFSTMQKEMTDAFEKGDIPEAIRLMDKYYNGNIFSLWHLFRDEQRKVLDMVLRFTYESIESSYRLIYENNSTIMNFYQNLQHRVPRPFLSAAEYIINTDIKRIFEKEDLDIEKLKKMIDEIKRWSIKIDSVTIGFTASTWINSIMQRLSENREDMSLFEKIDKVLELLKSLSLPLNLWNAQNFYFAIGKSILSRMKEAAQKGDESAQAWVEGFSKLGYYLYVKVYG